MDKLQCSVDGAVRCSAVQYSVILASSEITLLTLRKVILEDSWAKYDATMGDCVDSESIDLKASITISTAVLN